VNYVEIGFIIVVETYRLKWLGERSGAVRGVRLTDLESYRKICKTRYDKLTN
jgi:hypothetical protein